MALTLEQQLAKNASQRRDRLKNADLAVAPTASSTRPADSDAAAREVEIERVRANPENARQIDLNDPEQAALMEDLVQSIQTHGLLQAPLVRPLPDGDYEVIAGDRRLIAARRAGLKRIPVRVRQAEDAVLRQINLVENLVRANLSAADMGHGFARLKAALEQSPTPPDSAETSAKKRSAKKTTPGSRKLKWADVASITGLTPRSMQRYIAVAQLIEELDLPADQKAKVKQLKEKQLRPALSLKTPQQRRDFVKQLGDEKLSSREAAARAKAMKGGTQNDTSKKPALLKSALPTDSTLPTDPINALMCCEEEIGKALQALREGRFSAPFWKRRVQPRLNNISKALLELETMGKS